MLDRKIPYGDTPVCVECGECFTNWERILLELGKKTAKQVREKQDILLFLFKNHVCLFLEFARCGEISKLFECSRQNVVYCGQFCKQQQ